MKDQATCLDLGQDISLVGGLSAYTQSSVFLGLMPCRNTTGKRNCYSEEKRTERLSEISIGILYSSQKFNKNNYDKDTIVTSYPEHLWISLEKGKEISKFDINLQRDDIILYDDLIYSPYGRPQTISYISSRAEPATIAQ